jgi:hypothetical protein
LRSLKKSLKLDLDEEGKRLFGGEANAGVAFQIGQLRYIHLQIEYVPVYDSTYFAGRVGEGTAPLAIVVYIDGSFVQHKILVKLIYVSDQAVQTIPYTVSLRGSCREHGGQGSGPPCPMFSGW